MARAAGEETLTDALAQWTSTLWSVPAKEPGQPPPAFYLDGHKKPVYTDHLIPRGLVGRTGKILGCRARLLLHDAAGHPLFATTHRGDLHLTRGASAELSRYEQAIGSGTLARLIIDREGMAAEFLAALGAQGRTVVTILRSNQYQGLASFTEVGDAGATLPGPRRGGDARRGERPVRPGLTRPSRSDAEACGGADP